MAVVLVSYLVVPEWELGCNHDLDVVEMFAGVARITRLAAWTGLKARAFEIKFTPLKEPHKRKRGKLPRAAMDLNGSAGFGLLDFNFFSQVLVLTPYDWKTSYNKTTMPLYKAIVNINLFRLNMYKSPF